MMVSSEAPVRQAEYLEQYVIPCGLFEIDQILFRGQGGFVRGCRYQIWGKPKSCKSATGYRLLGNTQKRCPDLKVALVDTETRYRDGLLGNWIEVMGVSRDRLDVFQPQNLDSAYRLQVELAESAEYAMILWDSYASTKTSPTAEVDLKKYRKKAYGSRGRIGEGPRVNRQGIPDVSGACDDNKVLWVIINQTINLINDWGAAYGFPGGHPLEHGMDAHLFLERKKDIVEEGVTVGRNIRARVTGSSLFLDGAATGPEGLCPDVRFYFDGRNVDPLINIVETAISVGVVEQRGAIFSWRDISAKGKLKFTEAVESLKDELWEATRSAMMEQEEDEEGEFELVFED
jgi:RecA/RadA recombinase